MKIALPAPLLGLILLLAVPTWGQDAPSAAPARPDAPAPAAAATDPHQQPSAPEPSAEDRAAAAQALATVDTQRLFRDRDYAAAILHDIDLLSDALPTDADAAALTRTLRLAALTTLQRGDEARPLIDQLLESRPRDAHFYAAPLMAAAALEDKARIVDVVETASENVPGVGWSELRSFIDRDAMGGLLGQLQRDHQDGLRARLAGALFRIGWPGNGDPETGDYLRTILLDDRLSHDDRPAAADYLAGITTPAATLSLIVGKRYDPLLAPDADRLALLQRALAAQDQDTADALAAAPADPHRVLDRVRYLRGLGRDADALVLLQPFIRDVRATAGTGDDGIWLVNEAAYALVALGRDNEALALMRRLAALPIDRNAALIAPGINYSLLLWEAGRYGDALDQANRLDREAAPHASDFGKMWIDSAIACALARLNRGGEAAPQLARLSADPDANPTALMRAYLCLGEDDAAANLLVHRLESGDPDSALLSLQDYTESRGSAQSGPLYDRLIALRDRPAVRAAIDRVGRVMSLPLSRTYWSDF